jgi:PAS domain S-box-containing protein
VTRAQILVVEDEIVVAESLRNQLESLGYDVPAIVAFGDAAIEKAGETRPDLILMDIKLAGGVDGIEAAEQIYSRFDIPVVYLTAFADNETLQRARITEPFGYILKPFRVEDLRINIEIALYKHRMESELRASEERYRQSVENSPNPIFSIDQEGIILTWNPACQQVFQYEAEQIIGQTYHKLLWDLNDRPAIEAMMAQVWQGHPLSNQDIIYRSRDGTQRFTISRLYPLHDPKGNVQECVFANTDITKRRQAEKEIRQQTAHVEALRLVELELMAQLDLDALLLSVATHAMELLGGTSGELSLYRPERDVLVTIARAGVPGVPMGTTFRRGEGLAGTVWETNAPVVIGNHQQWEGRIPEYDGLPIVAAVGVPIRWEGADAGDEFLGTLIVASDAPDVFSQADADLLSLLTTQAAIAIRNARLYETERKRVTQLTVVNQIARRIASILDPQLLLQEIVSAIQQGLGYYNVALLLLGENTDELTLRAIAGGFKDTGSSDYHQKVGTGMIGWAAETGQPLLANDVSQDPHYIPGFLGENALNGSELCVPIKVAGRIIGVLDAQDIPTNAFDETDLTAMETLADQIAAAIESARLYEETRRHAQKQEAVSRIAYALNTLDLKTALPVLAEGLQELTGCEHVSLAVPDEADENIKLLTLKPGSSLPEKGTTLPFSATSAFKDLAAGHPHMTPDLSAEMDSPGEQALYQAGIRSRINLPLIIGGETIGALNLASRQPGAFWKDRLPALQQVADAVASAIENNRLFQSAHTQHELAKALEEAATAVSSTLEFDQVLDRVLEQVERVITGDAFNISLIEEGNVRVVRWRAQEYLDVEHRGLDLIVPATKYSSLTKMMQTGKSIVIPDTTTAPDWVQRENWEWVHSYVGAPIQLADSTIGFLSVDGAHPNQFGPADAQRLEAFASHVATAIRNAQLYEQSQNRMQSLVNLNQASQILASSLDVKKVLDQIVNLAGSVVNSDYTSVVLSNEDGQLTRQADDFRGVPPISQRIRREGTTHYVLHSGKPLVVDTISDEGVINPPLYYPDREPLKANSDIVAAGIHSFAAIPIQVKGKTMGVLFVHSRTPHAFYGQLSLLTTFANQAAVAIENAHLFQAEQEQRELSDALAEAAAAVNTLDLDQVLDRILEQVERIVAGDTFNVMLVEKDVARLVRCRGYGRIGKEEMQTSIAHLIIPISKYPNLTKMAKTGEPIVISDTTTDPNWVPSEGPDWRRSYVGAPIRMEGKTIGFLNVNGLHQDQFSPADARRLQVFANHIAAAVTNARLHQEVLDYAEQLEERVQERTALLMAQYARLEAILHSTADGIISTDEHGGILQVNPVAHTWLTQSLSWEDARRLQETVRNLAQKAAEQPRTVLELTDRDLEIKIAPISKPDLEGTFTPTQGEPAAVVAIHDISELKALDRLKTNFVRNASHELRTPITTIKLYVHLMQQISPNDDKWRQYMDALVQEIDNQAQLGEDILQLSRIYAGRTKEEMNRRAIPLNDLVEAVAIRNRSLAQKSKLTLEYRPMEPGPIAMADTEQTIQVLSILVENAIRYTPAGGHVVIATGQNETEGCPWATAAVSDTGERIPEEDMPRIFDRLFREGDEEPLAMRVRETGLRLMVVKEIVNLHEGQVTVESDKDTGTTFTIWLPLAD